MCSNIAIMTATFANVAAGRVLNAAGDSGLNNSSTSRFGLDRVPAIIVLAAMAALAMTVIAVLYLRKRDRRPVGYLSGQDNLRNVNDFTETKVRNFVDLAEEDDVVLFASTDRKPSTLSKD